ncbi:MAG TPA: SHOCT domain-containing protein [Candidatus Binataceae bacterium]|jgi:hypothetical protein|nr:SHOCT domain-containing protein [Candidatus Binataceae bacterium]
MSYCINCEKDLGKTASFCTRCGAAANPLIEEIPAKLAAVLKQNLQPGERVEVQLKGQFKEALVCTDRRVMILKAGFMTGAMFGSNVFQLPYRNISGVDVKKHLLTGYFEVSAGGMQNTTKSYWANDARSAEKSPNCVSLVGADRAALFRQACSFIMERVGQAQSISPAGNADLATLDRLAALRDRGALTDDEFEAKKAEILARL